MSKIFPIPSFPLGISWPHLVKRIFKRPTKGTHAYRRASS